MPAKVTVAKVNAALAKAGIRERLRRGIGYYYFFGGSAAGWYSSAVYVNRVDALTVGQWLAEHNRLAGI